MTAVPTTVLGVDFSAAAHAGEKIWIAQARIEGEVLRFDSLQRATDLPNGAVERDAALDAARAFLATFSNAACGFDFPFSLARESIAFASWREWLASLREYSDAAAFAAAFSDVRRETDKAAKTPFSPLNLRMFRQTFHGLRDVVLPLLENGAVALPFEEPHVGALWLLEVCPASLLKKQKLYLSYKGKSTLQRENRETVLQQMCERVPMVLPDELRQLALGDTEGDALDAVLAAVGTFRVLQHSDKLQARNERERFEGRVYF